MVPFEKAYTDSYWSTIVSIGRSCNIFKLFDTGYCYDHPYRQKWLNTIFKWHRALYGFSATAVLLVQHILTTVTLSGQQILHRNNCIHCWYILIFNSQAQRTLTLQSSSSSCVRVMNHNWSATKQRLHPQSVAEISRHSVLSGDSMWQCGTSSGSRHKDTDQCL